MVWLVGLSISRCLCVLPLPVGVCIVLLADMIRPIYYLINLIGASALIHTDSRGKWEKYEDWKKNIVCDLLLTVNFFAYMHCYWRWLLFATGESNICSHTCAIINILYVFRPILHAVNIVCREFSKRWMTRTSIYICLCLHVSVWPRLPVCVCVVYVCDHIRGIRTQYCIEPHIHVYYVHLNHFIHLLIRWMETYEILLLLT